VDGRRCSQGIVAIILVLAFTALFFDDVAPAAAAGALLIFLIYRYFVFSREVSRLAASFTVEREMASSIVRQGAEVGVTVRIKVHPPVPLHIDVTDMPPDGVHISEGSNRGSFQPGADDGITLCYAFRAVATGEIPFGGVAVGFSDAFFRTDLIFGRESCRKPRIRVFPLKVFNYEKRDLFGEGEIDRETPVAGHGVRSFREYVEGDQLKNIDWKLSAKFNKPIVREYMGREGRAPLFVIDLPDRALPVNDVAFQAMKEKASGILVREMQGAGEASVAVISGGNLLRFLPQERDLGQVLKIVQEMAPADRMNHLYRATDASRLFGRFIRGEQGPEKTENGILADLERHFLRDRQRTLFETQIAGVLHAVQSADVLVFSLLEGDTSHMGLITLTARDMHRKVQLYIPRESFTPRVRSRIAPYPIEVLEAR
jgi:uncharacterized protein (DUF58 family)